MYVCIPKSTKKKNPIYDYLKEYSKDFLRFLSIKFLRIMFGHTMISYGFIFKRNFTPFCNCYVFRFIKTQIFRFLMLKTYSNKIKFLKKIKLLYEI